MSWGYETDNGPDKWNKLFPIADGDSQSPVDIVTASAVYDESLKSHPLTMEYDGEKELVMTNTGHSVASKINQPSILSGGPLSSKYRLEQFHLHWGITEDRGSEHTIDGKEFSGELHLVHWNCDNYGSFADAVDKRDGLSVVGVMIKSGSEHPGFKLLSENVAQVQKAGSKFAIQSEFNPKCLLPGNTSNYWTYHGSLTTPPLFETVEWIVLQEPIEFSKAQLESLKRLTNAAGLTMQDNFRPPCPIRERRLRKSFN